ncbi:MAG: Uma2 family endonuclease [Deltaproteobacteria bacterium]|nr:Uma2 family endonuclease [Deltaproteobacteria bacterium]
MDPSRKAFTYRDYLNTPDDVRYQLIEGELVREPAPTVPHQSIVMNLSSILWNFAKSHGLGRVLAAPTDVYLSETNVVQPDVLFVSSERTGIVTERCIHGAPDLVVEIASPSTVHRDRGIKRELYARHGVAEYWLVDPVTETVEVLRLTDRRFVIAGRYNRSDTLMTPALPGLAVHLNEVFA